ncbi:MAG: baseplate J/gp47 family protein [Ruminococcus flavefaciens]|nr:baseplate J/gp47 family protein [Ruminococcus flavefaciens]
MIDISVLDNIPEIDLIDEEGLDLSTIQGEMVSDYEYYYERSTGEELILYPADERRVMINVIAGKLYQLAEIANDRFRQNFIKYMYGESLKNWAGNFGYMESGLEYAKTILQFTVSEQQEKDIVVLAGTRATAGDGIYFATGEDLIIPAGEMIGEVEAVCTVGGTEGNNYMEGQISTLVDPVGFIKAVANITQSSGGHDEYTDDELKEKVLNFQYIYSTAGPTGQYEKVVKDFDQNIVDVRCITDYEATVKIYVMKEDIPTEAYLKSVADYIEMLKTTPDTDKVEVCAPSPRGYAIHAVYYIPESSREIADSIRIQIGNAVEEFTNYTASRIGRAINPGLLINYAGAAGARMVVSSPKYEELDKTEVGLCTGIELEFGGYEEE